MRVQSGGVGERPVGTVAMRIVDVHVYRNDGTGGGGGTHCFGAGEGEGA